MISVFIIIFKGTFGIMGWRRKILVSTLLGFLVSLMMFELADDFEETEESPHDSPGEVMGHHGTTAHILEHTTLWLWPEFVIDTLEHMNMDNVPVSSKKND